jgi:hypothetical protein
VREGGGEKDGAKRTCKRGSLVVGCLPSMCEALGSISSAVKQNIKRERWQRSVNSMSECTFYHLPDSTSLKQIPDFIANPRLHSISSIYISPKKIKALSLT